MPSTNRLYLYTLLWVYPASSLNIRLCWSPIHHWAKNLLQPFSKHKDVVLISVWFYESYHRHFQFDPTYLFSSPLCSQIMPFHNFFLKPLISFPLWLTLSPFYPLFRPLSKNWVIVSPYLLFLHSYPPLPIINPSLHSEAEECNCAFQA